MSKRRAAIAFALFMAGNVSAQDLVDILKDGASAIYGSDAIGGVFNILIGIHPSAPERLRTATMNQPSTSKDVSGTSP